MSTGVPAGTDAKGVRVRQCQVTAADGALQLSEGGGYGVDLVPVEGGRFMGIGFPSPLSFERDAAGHVIALITWELGPYRWERVR